MKLGKHIDYSIKVNGRYCHYIYSKLTILDDMLAKNDVNLSILTPFYASVTNHEDQIMKELDNQLKSYLNEIRKFCK